MMLAPASASSAETAANCPGLSTMAMAICVSRPSRAFEAEFTCALRSAKWITLCLPRVRAESGVSRATNPIALQTSELARYICHSLRLRHARMLNSIFFWKIAKLRLPVWPALALSAALLVVLPAQAEERVAQDNASRPNGIRRLQTWIERDLYFFRDPAGKARLFLRRQPVNVGLAGLPGTLKDEVGALLADLSKAAGVTYQQTSADVNLAIVVDSPIQVADKPNPALWKRVGLNDEMYKIVSEAGPWTSGCGVYSFGNAQTGQVGLSIVFVDSKLDAQTMTDCVIEGTLRAFGVRSNRKLVTRSEDGYLQFVAVVAALRECERALGADSLTSLSESEQKSRYSECAARLVSGKLY